jgi:hypothetical protein
MGIFDKIFGKKEEVEINPDNSKLLQLLEVYQQKNGTGESYKNVLTELINGNSFLLLPSANNDELSENWTKTEKDTTLQLTCIFNLDGLKVLGAFTDEKSLLSWTKNPSQYTALSSQDILKFCEENLIERLVINSDLPTMYVLERSRENVKTETIEKDTTVQVGTPNNPLNKNILLKLNENFKRIEIIEEVYQYGQTKNEEFSIVLGFKLSVNSENAKTATINAVQTALQNEKIDQLLDLFFIENNSWYNTIRNVENSLIYKK